MSDDLEKRLKAMEMAIHSQTVAMRHMAQDVRELSEAIEAIALQLFKRDDVERIPDETEAEKLLGDVLEQFSAGRGPDATR
ncbi:hypothetical protein [Roseibium alexandrii]|uniref:hypothetical protein n=1 Tax=Roseibium alexandrii TaxID=388408 RepID=UPI003750E993